MTNQDVLVQILSEVTGHPKKRIRRVVKAVRSALADRGKEYDRELEPHEAERLLTSLRAEKAGVLSWLVNGAREEHFHRMPASKTEY